MAHPTALFALSDPARMEPATSLLASLGFRCVAPPAAAAALRKAGALVIDLVELTGEHAPAARVGLLHPRILAALLAPADPEPAGGSIDWLFLDFPPLPAPEEGEAPFSSILTGLDLEASALARAAAASDRVTVLVDAKDWTPVVRAFLEHGAVPAGLRRTLAARALARASRYEAAVATRLTALDPAGGERPLPLLLSIQAEGAADLEAGDNPHQRAGLYKIGDPPDGALAGVLLVGYAQRTPTFAEVLDAAMGIEAANEHEAPAAVLAFRRKPVAVASAEALPLAVRAVLSACDGSFAGGVLAVNRRLDVESAEALRAVPIGCVVARSFEMDAMDALVNRLDLPLMALGGLLPRDRRDHRFFHVDGGLVLQDRDASAAGEVLAGRVTSARAPTEAELRALEFAWKVSKHARSDAAVLARRDGAGTWVTAGVGAGCASLREALEVALARAGASARGAVLAFDGPVIAPEVIREAGRAGVSAVAEPGGAAADDGVRAEADRAGMALVLTGRSHLRYE